MALLAGATALALLFAPGWLLGRAWGVRGLTAWGSAPALSLAVLGLGSILSPLLGVFWNWQGVLTGPTLWSWLALLLLGWATQRGRRKQNPPAKDAQYRFSVRGRRRLAGGLLAAVLFTGIPVWLATGGWNNPAQASDAVFHLSATAYVREGGNASPLGGLAAMYDGAGVYYPTGWHAVAALLPGSVSLGANLLVWLLATLAWPLAMAALLRETTLAWVRRGVLAWDPDAAVLSVGVALSGSTVSVLLLLTSVWPYALSVVLLPGCLALTVRAVSARLRPGPRLAALFLAGIGMFGVLMAHGIAVFNLAVLAGPVLLAVAARPLQRLWQRGGRSRVSILAGAAILLGALLASAWTMRAALSSVMSFARGSSNFLETVYGVLTDHPLLATFTPYIPGNLLVFVLAVAGAVFAWRRGARAWAWGFSLSVLLILLAAGPDWPLRALAGPWYTQRARIMPLVTICALVLAPLGIEWLRQRYPRSSQAATGWRETARQHVPAIVLVVSLILAPAWRWGLKTEIVAAVHDPEQIAYGTMLDTDELALIERAAAELPADAVVLGDPSNGSAYLWSVGGVQVLYPARPAPASGTNLRWLGEHLSEIDTNPQVCEILNERGVEYYYTDDGEADGTVGSNRAALWGSELSDLPREYLERVDSAGTATLWRITACE